MLYLLQESPTEQVIVWDIHRTYPAHEYFKEIGGEGQESLYKISKVKKYICSCSWASCGRMGVTCWDPCGIGKK